MYPWLTQGLLLVYTISSTIKLSNTVNITGTVLYQILDFNATHVVYLVKLNLNTTYGPLHLSEKKIMSLNETFSIPFVTYNMLEYLKREGLSCSNGTCHVSLSNETDDIVTYYNITIDKNMLIVTSLEERSLLIRNDRVVGESVTFLKLSK